MIKLPTNDTVWVQDEAERFKTALNKKDSYDHWLKRRLEEDERDIPDHIDRTPRGDTYHLPYRLTLASATAMAKQMIWALAP